MEAIESHLKDKPFTEQQVHSFNAWSNYTIDINKEFQDEIKAKETGVFQTLERLNIKDVPPEISEAFRYYRKALYNYYIEYSRNRSYYPPVSVVGPSKYPFHRKEKAMNQLDNINARITEAKNQFEKRIKPFEKRLNLEKQQSQFFDFYDRWIDRALKLKQREFVDELAKSLKDRAISKSPGSGYAQDLERGVFDHVYRKEANQQRKSLLEEAQRRGVYTPAPIEAKPTRKSSTRGTYLDKYTKQLTEEKEKPVYQVGVTEAYTLTKHEWDIAKNANKSNYADQGASRFSASKAVRNITELERLDYNTASRWDDIAETWNVDHEDVIRKAIAENRSRLIPDKVKAEYPALFKMPIQDVRRDYADVYIDRMIARLLAHEHSRQGSEKERERYLIDLNNMHNSDYVLSLYHNILKRIKERTGFDLHMGTEPYDSMIDFVQYLDAGKHINRYAPPELFPIPEQLEFVVRGHAKPFKVMSMKVSAKLLPRISYKTPTQRTMFDREQLELFGYKPFRRAGYGKL